MWIFFHLHTGTWSLILYIYFIIFLYDQLYHSSEIFIAGTSSSIQLAACIYSATWLCAKGSMKFINLIKLLQFHWTQQRLMFSVTACSSAEKLDKNKKLDFNLLVHFELWVFKLWFKVSVCCNGVLNKTGFPLRTSCKNLYKFQCGVPLTFLLVPSLVSSHQIPSGLKLLYINR
jgi:hypothetical protein